MNEQATTNDKNGANNTSGKENFEQNLRSRSQSSEEDSDDYGESVDGDASPDIT